MNQISQNSNTPKNPRKRAAIIAGLGVLIMAGLALFATEDVLPKTYIEGDAVATTENILGSKGLYLSAIISLFLVAVLDVIVAWALFVFFRPFNELLAKLSAWLRIAYALVFIIAQFYLLRVFSILGESGMEEQVLSTIEVFHSIWENALIIFGIHLIVLGLVVWQAGYMKKILGFLVIAAGVGYFWDGIARLLIPNFEAEIAMFTFFGEILLLFWLLIRGWKVAKLEAE